MMRSVSGGKCRRKLSSEGRNEEEHNEEGDLTDERCA